MSSFLKEYISTGFLFLMTGGLQYHYYRHKNDLFLERDRIFHRFKSTRRTGVK
jgi:hypothetical protein